MFDLPCGTGGLLVDADQEDAMMGDIVMPVERLEENFTSEFILQQLHSENRFDFEYAASEGDNLQIRKEYLYKKINGIPRPELYDYMSFIYRKGKWEEEVYDVFTDKLRKFRMGIVGEG